VRIQSTLDLSSVCAISGAVKYAWSAAPAAGGDLLPLPAALADTGSLLLKADALRAAGFVPGKSYVFTLRSWFETNNLVLEDSTVLAATRSELALGLRGPSGDVPIDRFVQLNADASDPDLPGANGFTYAWSCARSDLGGLACLTAGDEAAGNGTSWLFGAWQLQLDKPHALSVVVVSEDGRTATTSKAITPREANTPMGARREPPAVQPPCRPPRLPPPHPPPPIFISLKQSAEPHSPPCTSPQAPSPVIAAPWRPATPLPAPTCTTRSRACRLACCRRTR